MRKILFVFLFLCAMPLQAKIGKHNFLLNTGWGITFAPFPWPPLTEAVTDPARVGFAANFEVGYLLHSVRSNNVVHGFDFRVGAYISHASFKPLLGSTEVPGVKATDLQASGYFNMMYTAGRQFGTTRVMFLM